MKLKALPLLLALCLILCCGCGQTESLPPEDTAPVEDSAPVEETPVASIPQDNVGFAVGKTMPDFSFTTYDGQEKSLYATLAEKEVVLINIWASWCDPCAMEFPYMEEAYQQYSDRVEIFALSCEPTDTDEVIAEYVAEHGMSFPVAMDSPNIAGSFGIYSYPTTIVIDRFGTICAMESGAITALEGFTNIFDQFLAEDYTGYESGMVLSLSPCEVAPSSPEELSEALNGGSIVFSSVDSKYVWPMTVGEYDGRSVAASSNAGIESSPCVLNASLEAKAGEVLSICFALSSEDGMDHMRILVNDELVKTFNGEYGWTTYAYEFPADGSYEVCIRYEKDEMLSSGMDTLWLDSVEILSGADAEAALAANPKYVYGDSVSFEMLTPGAREIVFNDPHGILISPENAHLFDFYMVNGFEADMHLTLTSDYDPENYIFFREYDYSSVSLYECADESGYPITTAIDSLETTGYSYSSLYVSSVASTSELIEGSITLKLAVLFSDEENLNAFLADVNSYLVDMEPITWNYADEVEAPTSPLRQYTVRCIDEAGNPVPGVTVQICDESLCNVYVTDEKGECNFSLNAYPYEAHLLAFPEGWEAFGASESTLPEEGGVLTFLLKTK